MSQLAKMKEWRQVAKNMPVEPLLNRQEYWLLHRLALFALQSDERQYYRELAEALNIAPEACSILQAKLEA